jgi:hypothetical protein
MTKSITQRISRKVVFLNKKQSLKQPVSARLSNNSQNKSPQTGRQLNSPKKPSLESVLDRASVLVCMDKSGSSAIDYVAADLKLSRKQARQALVAAGVLRF